VCRRAPPAPRNTRRCRRGDRAVTLPRARTTKLVAAYSGDTAGQLWRIHPGQRLSMATTSPPTNRLHFSPTWCNSTATAWPPSHAHESNLVQVTNSNLDLDTSASRPSQMIFAKGAWRSATAMETSRPVVKNHVGHGWSNRAHHGNQPDLGRDPPGNRRHQWSATRK